MDEQERARLRALCEAASAGPWEQAERPERRWIEAPSDDGGEFVVARCAGPSDMAAPNAAFIAAARTALPAALDYLDAAEATAAQRSTPPRSHRPRAQPCPWTGVPYKDVPGYVDGYGCPACKGIGSAHLTTPTREQQAIDAVMKAVEDFARLKGLEIISLEELEKLLLEMP